MVQINYMIDVPFVMSHVHENIRDGLRTIVYHGLRLRMDEVMVGTYADADWSLTENVPSPGYAKEESSN
jgi:hypothetical protein